MDSNKIYEDIGKRTGGDIYIGVVGPVRTGKSSFIKRFMETLVLPNIESKYRKERAVDELPQSSAGRTIMTTEPKFVPEEAISLNIGENSNLRVRMIDCVGYILPSSVGYIENDMPRMVMTPWFEQEIPFNMAAEIGTQKVISEHSTIGIVVTTDGSISEIPREEYEEAEQRVIAELKELGKPFVVLLNCRQPEDKSSIELAKKLSEDYRVPVIPTNCLNLDEDEIKDILEQVLRQFPLKEVAIEIPRWVIGLSDDHWLKTSVLTSLKDIFFNMSTAEHINYALAALSDCRFIDNARFLSMNYGKGAVKVGVTLEDNLFFKILGETTGLNIQNEADLLSELSELTKVKTKYNRYKNAIEEVNATGYGIVMPELDEMQLDEPEIIKQGGRYGVKLKACAPSIHLMRTDISAEVAPIVGSEKQSRELVHYLMKEFEEAPEKIWESNIFGKSLHGLVNEGLHSKLYSLPNDARLKVQQTLQRVINEGCNGLICIIF